ncbi:SPOR domain-containing protein [Oceaniserpentilla sp. 4NH20-0058]|uniref:SPOR domain-containing protein n=1 Tax=Oceaniserpentilla sp. 4NH20-0058 TaxID=3127660 RepID=UPI0031047D31
MEQGVKRKLIGAGVLSALAIIVLPQLSPSADDASYLSQSVVVEENIPKMDMPLPKSLNIVTPDPQSVANQVPAKIPMSDMKIDKANIKVDDFNKPILEKTGQAVVWHIQVASFAKPKNALDLRDSLRKAGYKAFELQSKDGLYTRVFVGPSTQKDQLQAQQIKIKQEFKLNGQIVVFEG